ncbi:MAG: fimbrillin family protein [Prevotella sp.]|nr:fimbrillin family protein [Prevotella sp.]
MKQYHILYVAVLAALMACSSDTDTDNNSVTPLQLTASQQTAAAGGTTRAADGLYSTGFDGTETVRVYFNGQQSDYSVGPADTGNGYTSTLYRGNLDYPTTDTGNAPVWAIYPQTSAPTAIGGTASHTVAYDQTDDAAYKASDLMYATAQADLTRKALPVHLQFAHQLVKVKVVITKDADVTSMGTVKMTNVKRQATVSIVENALTLSNLTSATGADEAEGDNILLNSTAITDVAAHTFVAVFPPQSWDDQPFLTVAADSKTMTYYLTKNFTAGHAYTLTLTVDNAALQSKATIINWTQDDDEWTVSRYHQ